MAVNTEQNTVILFLEFSRQTLLGQYCRDCRPLSSLFRTSKWLMPRMSVRREIVQRRRPGPKGHSFYGLKVVYFQYTFNLKAPGPRSKPY
jgi:hypothetical protein